MIIQNLRCISQVSIFSDHKCENEGECIDLANGYMCNCKPGWDGDYCEHAEDTCMKYDPCKAGSTCVSQFLGYKCMCQAGQRTLSIQNNLWFSEVLLEKFMA